MDQEQLNQLAKQLRSESIYQSRMALDELAKVPSEIAVPVLQQLSQEIDFQQRRLAVMGLGNHLTDDAFQTLARLLTTEKDDNVLAEAANAIFEFGDTSVPLLKDLFFRHEGWLTRQTILSILMEANQDDILLAVVREGLKDEAQTVKETAILAMGPLMNRPAESEALALLKDLSEAENWRDRWRAATTLSLATNPVAEQLRAKLRQDNNHYVVAAALEAGVNS
ncbi:MAG: HEAT repeat domain-containing protein [Cyanobacteria bacterium P01_A01_bin.123]